MASGGVGKGKWGEGLLIIVVRRSDVLNRSYKDEEKASSKVSRGRTTPHGRERLFLIIIIILWRHIRRDQETKSHTCRLNLFSLKRRRS